MQTFLPYPTFTRSAMVLDYRRLGKQRVEAWQIYLALNNPKNKWRHHPAVKMWRGYRTALLYYGMNMCFEWHKRGFVDNMLPIFKKELITISDSWKFPHWLGNKQLHQSHRSNLLRKDKLFYSKYNWSVPDNLPYYWPV